MFTIYFVWLGLISRTVNTGPQMSGFQIVRLDTNQIEISISNFGKYGQTSSGTSGCWWPKGSGQNYIFGAGIWFGTIDSVTGDTLVTIGYGLYRIPGQSRSGRSRSAVRSPPCSGRCILPGYGCGRIFILTGSRHFLIIL